MLSETFSPAKDQGIKSDLHHHHKRVSKASGRILRKRKIATKFSKGRPPGYRASSPRKTSFPTTCPKTAPVRHDRPRKYNARRARVTSAPIGSWYPVLRYHASRARHECPHERCLKGDPQQHQAPVQLSLEADGDPSSLPPDPPSHPMLAPPRCVRIVRLHTLRPAPHPPRRRTMRVRSPWRRRGLWLKRGRESWGRRRI